MMSTNDAEILFVDDDRAILELVREYLAESGYRVEVVDNGVRALELIRDHPYAIVFTDIKMPDIDGLELLAAIKDQRPETEVIIVTGHGSMESAIKAMKHGSYDYLQKPFKLDVLKLIVDRILDAKKLKQEKVVLRKRAKERHRFEGLVGISLKMQEIYATLDRLRGAGSNVLIEGETGTGKELTAHVIHGLGAHREEPFVSVACQGFLKAAATDDTEERLREALRSAGKGTLFLDDICELPLPAQAVLAGFMAEFRSEGEAGGAAVARLVAATNRSVKKALSKGALDPRLHASLAEVFIQMPPLKNRKEDICLLINHFLEQFNSRSAKKVLAVAPEAMDYLLSYHWPGNVIQLENVIERAFALGVELVIQIDDLPAEIKTAGQIARMH
jgi:DNA-binding NtrC family response regulator